MLEQWLNDTLREAEELKVPGVYIKADYKNPIARYGIDRMALTNSGIPNEGVNHLYRSLYVYSLGFYNLVKEILDKSFKLQNGI